MRLFPRVVAAGLYAVFVASVASPLALFAQRADGTSAAIPATAAPKRVAPPIDDRTWIVVPFTNTSKNKEVDWVHDGSVNLLYTSMAQWTDVHVIDDKRVADFLRDIPAARQQSLTLIDGLAVAKRAGAGRLVMGTFIKGGNQTSISATVYDTRKGTQIRVVNQRAPHPDSIMSVIEHLAPKILDLPTPGGAGTGSVGTQRVDAYQEYLAGVKALNQFDIAEAKKRLERALALDSTFALAHYKLAVVSLYDEAAELERQKQTSISAAVNSPTITDPNRLPHATAAVRLSVGLPARERALTAGFLAQLRGDYHSACEEYGRIVKSDSLDAEALFGLGRCQYKDDFVEAVGGDTTKLRFRTSWNVALRDLRSAVRIDPTYHLAFQDILGILQATSRPGCLYRGTHSCTLSGPRTPEALAQLGTRRPAVVERDGDSLKTIPRPQTIDMVSLMSTRTRTPEALARRRRSLEDSRVAARDWVDAGPREARARKAYARILLAVGRPTDAGAQLAAISDTTYDPDIELLRVETAIKESRMSVALRILDSMRVRLGVTSASSAYMLIEPVFGQVREFGRLMLEAMGGSQLGTAPGFQANMRRIVSYNTQAMVVAGGAGGDSAVAAEADLISMLGPTGCGRTCVSQVWPTLAFGLTLSRPSPITLIDSVWISEPRLGPIAALQRKDTADLRRAARRLDSLSAVQVSNVSPDDGSATVAADAYLLLGDTTKALAMTRRTLDELMMYTGLEETYSLTGGTIAALWPRAMLLRADLAAARKQTDEARTWYKRFIDLWAKPDPDFKPLVDRARKAYTTLGGK